jgi:hypothetical protein
MTYKQVEYSNSHIDELHKIIAYKKPTKEQLDKKWEANYVSVDQEKIVSSKSGATPQTQESKQKQEDKRKQLLNTARTIPIFKDFSLNELVHVLKNPRITKYKPNTTILSAGSDANELYFIISGEVRAIQLSKLGTFETNENHHKGEFLNMYSFVKQVTLDRGYISGEHTTTIFRFEINDENLVKSSKTFKKFYLNIASYALEKNKLYHNELNSLIL